MSTPPATPTNPPPMPPATVSDLKSSIAVTLTDCTELVVPSWLTCALLPTNAWVVTWRIVTPTPPAMPTKPPPALAESPNTFSDDEAWTATPSKAAVSKLPETSNLPSYRPGCGVDLAIP